MIDFVNQHQIKPVIDAVFNLGEAESAFKKMDDYNQFGKIVHKVD